MKKVIVSLVLGLATLAALGQDQPADKKVIKDQAEYSAYMAAFNTQDPVQKAAAMEAFIKQYPNSVVKSDALEQLVVAYTAAGNQAKVEETAKRILADSPNNVSALAIDTDFERGQGTPQSIAAAGDSAQKGLQALSTWTKPEGMSDADFETAKNKMTEIFNGAAGFAALQANDYAGASAYYLKSIAKDPNNLQDIYQLSLADLGMTPINLDGFWYGARAITLAGNNVNAVKTIAYNVKKKYRQYHGKTDDWDKFVATTVGETGPPPDMAKRIPPAPTPCDLALDAVKNSKPEEVPFVDKEFVLAHANCSPANKEAADKVWQAILSKQKVADGTEAKMRLPSVLVIKASKDTVEAAITEDNQEAKKADLTVMLQKPVLHPPEPGAMIDVVGVITKYDPDPFMFTMEQGTLPGAKPVTPPKHPVHRAANQKPQR